MSLEEKIKKGSDSLTMERNNQNVKLFSGNLNVEAKLPQTKENSKLFTSQKQEGQQLTRRS